MSTWQEDFKTAVKKKETLEELLDFKIDDCDYSFFIPRNFLKKIKAAGPDSPLWKQFIPTNKENHSTGLADPIGDQKFLVTKNIIHRYKNRALFIPTINCPITCRYCFRKNELDTNDIFKSDYENSWNYLKNNPQIEEIILTGGDPLILSNEKLLELALRIHETGNIKFLRFHSRTPIILPNRIDPDFIDVIKTLAKKFEQITFMIHVNHADEIDSEVIEGILKLKQTSIMLFSQTVLLKEINDDETCLKNLFLKLGKLGVIPYYLHHPDNAKGTDHFKITLTEGRKVYAKLRNILPGWLIPQYIFDIPNGEGKVSAFNPESFDFSGKLINLKSELTNFQE